MNEPVHIDGSRGEGGGQILRSSLALSLITGRPLVIDQVRAGRRKPGLLRQHLAGLRAATTVGAAKVEGAELGAGRIGFAPKAIRHGDYRFAVGSAGSATLVLHTILWPLLVAPGRSRLVFEGGTHNRWAPPFEQLTNSLLPILRAMGVNIEAKLELAGFYPAGGGRFVVELEGDTHWRPLRLDKRGAPREKVGRVITNALPAGVVERQFKLLRSKLGLTAEELRHEPARSPGPGNVVQVELRYDKVCNVFTSFGERKLSSQRVIRELKEQVDAYLSSTAPVDAHLADQLLIPLTLAREGSFVTHEPTEHTRTNAEVIAAFIDPAPEIGNVRPDGCVRVCVPSHFVAS